LLQAQNTSTAVAEPAKLDTQPAAASTQPINTPVQPSLDQVLPVLPNDAAPAGGADLPPELPADFFELLLKELLNEANAADSNSDVGSLGRASSASPAALSDDEVVGKIVFSDESPFQVINLLQSLTQKPVLIQQGLPNVKINFSSDKPLSKKQAIDALEGLLTMNGIAIAPLGEDFLRAVPSTSASAQAPAILTDSAKDQVPTSQIFSKFYHLEYINATDALTLLKPFLTANISTIIAFDKQQSILITDTLVNLQYVESILDKIDRPAMSNEKIFFLRLKNATASELQKKIAILQDKGIKNRFQGTTIIEPDDRTNQLIVITHPANLPELEQFIHGLDADSTSFTYSEAYRLRHAESTKVAAVINEIVNGQKQAKDAKQKRSDTASQELLRQKADNKTQTNAVDANLEFSDYLTVVADERSNAIIAYGTRSDLEQVKRLVNQIDILLPQVRIEVVISEVTITDQSKRGIDAFDLNYNFNATNASGAATGLQLPNIAVSGNDGSYTVRTSFIGVPFDLNSVFRRGQSNNNIRILSAPTIVTTHNKEAVIEVIQEQPVITNTITDTQSNSALNTAVNNSIGYKDIGIILKVKPLIGPNGVIQMEIDQTISNKVSEVNLNGFPLPVIGKRQAQSFVSAVDQEVIILGGLRENTFNKDRGKLFLLGDLPIVGNLLFSPRNKQNVTREIVIFIKPYLVGMPEHATKPIQSMEEQVSRMIDLSANREEQITFLSEGRFPDVPPTNMNRILSTVIPECEQKAKPTPTAAIPIEIDQTPPPVVP